MADQPGGQAEGIPGEQELREIEQAALDLARTAGATIIESLGSTLTIEYKTAGIKGAEPTDPVSQIDRKVEELIRLRLGSEFPGHGIIGEEVEDHPAAGADYIWAIDPVDGTSNFINGFPLYSASIGVLHRGVPIAGATWVSTSRELRPGVMHARLGGPLSFEGEPMPRRTEDPAVRRPLAGAPGGSPGRTARWDNRVTGSAAIEAAFTAGGLLTFALLGGLHIWDVAAGTALLRAAELDIRVRRRGAWQAFDRFEAPARVKADRAPTLRDWSEPLAVGRPESVEHFLRERPPTGLLSSMRRLVGRRGQA
jgi:myo-inositol-1(or 4)-monophosphatase